jgi:IPT/TIG domain
MRRLVLASLFFVAATASAQPSVVDMSPLQGSTGGGDVVLIRVTNLPVCDPVACPVTVYFDNIPAVETSTGFDGLRAITPPHDSGNAVVTLRFFDKVIATLPWTFRFAGPGEVGAPDTFNFEPVVIPLAVGTIAPGAFGSRWKTELWVSNSADRDVAFFIGYPQCIDLCPRTFPSLAAHAAQLITLGIDGDPTNAGYLFYVQKGGAQNVHFSLRVRDVSRTGENAGTELPVFRIPGFTTNTATLLNVPVEQASRTTLRIYGNSALPVTLRVFSLPGDTLVASFDVPVAPADLRPYGETHGFPARSEYAQIGDLHEKIGDGNYRIEVTSDGSWVWALATVTNNTTQLVTAIASTPDQPYGVLRQ